MARAHHLHAGTVVCNDGLDLLADFMGVGAQIEALTHKVCTIRTFERFHLPDVWMCPRTFLSLVEV